MVLEFIKRHRGKFTFGTVAVGALLAIKGANRGAYVSKFIELSSVHQRCRAEEAMKLYTSDNRHRRCDTLIISLLNTVREKIEERFPIETLTEELRNERRYAKVLLIWQEIKVNTFARIMTASYAMSLITVAMKSQMSILINQINWSNSKSEETSENQTFVSELFNYFFATENLRPASEKSLIVQAKTERIYFQCIVYFVQYGLKDFMKFVHSVCREETSTVDFKRKYNWNEFYDLLKSIQQRIHMADSRNFSRLIVPEFSSFLNQQSSFSIQVDMDEENLSSNMGLSILLNRNMEMLESTKSKEATSAFVDMFIRAALLPIKGNGNSGPLELALILPLLSNDFRRLFRSDFDAVIQNVLCSTELHELCVYVSSLPPL